MEDGKRKAVCVCAVFSGADRSRLSSVRAQRKRGTGLLHGVSGWRARRLLAVLGRELLAVLGRGLLAALGREFLAALGREFLAALGRELLAMLGGELLAVLEREDRSRCCHRRVVDDW